MESYIPNEFCFPKRPKLNNLTPKVNLLSNYFSFENIRNKDIVDDINLNSIFFNKYAINIDPEIPGDNIKKRSKIWRAAKGELTKTLKHIIFNNSTCYSKTLFEDDISIEVIVDDVVYTMTVRWTNTVEQRSEEALSLYKKFFGGLVRKLDLITIRRNYFQRGNSQKIDNIEVWQGFNPTVNLTSIGILLNINVIHKVLRPDTALDNLNKIRDFVGKNLIQLKQELEKTFNNAIVLTRYNNDKTYIIDHVDIQKTPRNKFAFGKDGEEISYTDYYKEKYDRKIKKLDQPLFAVKDKKKNEYIYLVPELCFMTGLTDEMRSNFNIMKRLAEISSGNPEMKLRECQNLIKQISGNEKCKKDIENYQIRVKEEPIKVTGYRVNGGNYIMKNDQFSIDSNDVDRRIQNEMLSQPKLHKWMVNNNIKNNLFL